MLPVGSSFRMALARTVTATRGYTEYLLVHMEMMTISR